MGKRYPKHVNIIASEDPSKPDGVDFHLEKPDGTRLASIVFDKGGEGMSHDDEHEVHFSLVQESGMTLEFAQSKKDVLWVAWGDKDHEPPCPETQPANCPDPVFYAEKSAPKKLTVVNTNPKKSFFSFTINFVDPHSQTPTKLIPFDPIGENKNGGIGASESSFALASSTVALLVGVAVVLAIGYVLLT